MHKLLARLSLLLLLAAPLAHAQDKKEQASGPCRGAEAHWDCPGVLELRDEKAGKLARLSWFSSGELLGERVVGPDTQGYLVLLPSRRVFYAKVPELGLGNNALNPFYRYDRLFAAALAALKSSFAKGPASVPVGETLNDVQWSGKPARLTTWRKQGEHLINFELSPADGPAERGFWDPQRPAAWEDKTRLDGWLDPRGNKAPATVGEARKPEAPAAPVSPSSAAPRSTQRP